MQRFKSANSRGGRMAISLQDLGQRLSFILVVCAALALLLAGKAESGKMEIFRALMTDLTAPVLEVASRPLQMLRESFAQIDVYFSTSEENRLLREKVERLQSWQALALKLQKENQEFRSLLNMHDVPQMPYLSARVIGDMGSPFVHTVLINAGKKHGVQKDMPVAGAEGLIGRIVSTGNQVSRVLLLSDLNSRVPVRLEASGYQSVLAGDNERQPLLVYLPDRAQIKVGDRVVTSGHGGVFPPGIPVGMVSAVKSGPANVEVRVRTFVDERRLSFVQILQFSDPEYPPGTLGEKKVSADHIAGQEVTPIAAESAVQAPKQNP